MRNNKSFRGTTPCNEGVVPPPKWPQSSKLNLRCHSLADKGRGTQNGLQEIPQAEEEGEIPGRAGHEGNDRARQDKGGRAEKGRDGRAGGGVAAVAGELDGVGAAGGLEEDILAEAGLNSIRP